MLKKIVFFLLITTNLFSSLLDSTYFVQSHNIKLRDIFPSAQYNVTLYKIDKNRYSKKIKTKELIKLLQTHGYTSLESLSRYIKFIKKSPIDLSIIRENITSHYKDVYPEITIKKITIIPRSYTKHLPDSYKVLMPKKYFLNKKGTLSIKTFENKKFFFEYIIDAKVTVYTSKNNIQKSVKLSALNTKKTSLQLDKFRAFPMIKKDLLTSQAKRNIKANRIITQRDIETLNYVVKGSNVVVNLDSNNINISFLAKALQSGKLHDIITVQKRNMKRLRVQIIGKNQVQIK